MEEQVCYHCSRISTRWNIPKLPNNTATVRAELCQWFLSGPEHMRPFYFWIYKELETNAEGTENKVTALAFCISHLLTTYHFSMYVGYFPVWIYLACPRHALHRNRCNFSRSAVQEKTSGSSSSHNSSCKSLAQMMFCNWLYSFQIKRAVTMWLTGEKIEQCHPNNDFSRANWGDTTIIHKGNVIPILTTTNLVNIVNKLKVKQWDKIVTTAMSVSKSRKVVDKGSGGWAGSSCCSTANLWAHRWQQWFRLGTMYCILEYTVLFAPRIHLKCYTTLLLDYIWVLVVSFKNSFVMLFTVLTYGL